ncbi:hypothetical protein GCM10027344_20810 [Spelaeicoccus albus]
MPGTLVEPEDLIALGFVPHDLDFGQHVEWPGGTGIEWATLGQVPDSAGVYLFTIGDGDVVHVAYVGLTTHLWMVTKGHLPHSGGARGGQRYGKPRHAGVTRKRVNALIAQQVDAGRTVQHWLRELPRDLIVDEEDRLIHLWSTRSTGWNIG